MGDIEFSINGRRIREGAAAPTTTLLQYLRGPLGLTGTKEGCAEGDCGACTVAVREPAPLAGADGHGGASSAAAGGVQFRAINACLVLLPSIHGKELVTVEGLGGPGAYHPVQTALVEALGSQCGYCTPGVVMSMFEACYRRDLAEPWQLEDQMAGNLCRCTGYRPIREATRRVAGSCPQDAFAEQLSRSPGIVGSPDAMLAYAAAGGAYFAPTSLAELWDVLDAHPGARLVAGGTDLGLEVTKQFKALPLLVSLDRIGELARLARDPGGLRIGAGVRIADLEAAARDGWPSIERMLRYFGARQIKNRATVGGNLCTASPIGDLAPVLISLGAVAVLRARAGVRRLPLEDFFQSYRVTALGPNEILEAVEVPAPAAGARIAAYKVSKRQQLDISTLSLGCALELDGAGRVQAARFAFGGMAATPKRAGGLEAALRGQIWSPAAIEAALPALEAEFAPLDDHRGSAWYRRTVARNLVRGFFEETARESAPRLGDRPTGTIRP